MRGAAHHHFLSENTGCDLMVRIYNNPTVIDEYKNNGWSETKIRRNPENPIKLIDLCAGILAMQAFDKNLDANLSYEKKECFIDAANSLYHILSK